MLFNSLPYFFLFSITYLVYWNVNQRAKRITLIIASIAFYGFFSIPFLFHFIGIVVINYLFSNQLWKMKEQGRDTAGLLRWVVALNVINLGVFKYFYFVTDSIYFFTGAQGVQEVAKSWDIFLPLAISFYSFQLIALQVDIHRNLNKEKISFPDYFIFILFFPQLIAGPIMRTDNFLPQLNNPTIDADRMKKGLFLIISGLFKKVVIAETVSSIINPLYLNPSAYDPYSLALGLFGFACQIYCDFSGYTDIARGSANLLGYEIPENFRAPFFSTSMKDLFRRWHVTLSTWLRDYIYIPLGGGKTSLAKSNLNLVITNVLGGLWHGANIGFVLWGLYLGLFISLETWLEKLMGNRKIPDWKIVKVLQVLYAFTLFSFSAIFFRCASRGSESLATTWEYATSLFRLPGNTMTLDRVDEIWTFMVLAFIFNAFQYSDYIYNKLKPLQNYLLPICGVIMLLLLGVFGDSGNDFIYFQF
ncbi:MBOAT family O-acyltransferase [Leptospira sp. GIMC2001]|uniref:MBOAT family O-acyltransferase n=1 Tax=Leptospira sp. GIMC2001 TaxID=1513297 RepID=UPI00234AEA87|nr:MBOAT family O-acyltransferase [Leptospira sp. GIMC2001]WCL48672.1 MBOAT family protein [Leptospira sp. GIMC2001]